MTIQEIISNLVKNRWSYGDIAKQAGVSKATISRWHKGTVKANKTLEEIVEKNLKDYVDRDKFDAQADEKIYWEKYLNSMKERKLRKEYEIVVVDDMTFSVDEQIEWHEKALAELKAQKEKKKWKFTEDEKVILRNLDKKFKWIARDFVAKGLKVFDAKPIKGERHWACEHYIVGCRDMNLFTHLFKCIQWSDEQPCEFRKFI